MLSKENIKQACIKIVEQRMSNAEIAMHNAQESSNNEEKSSAGDKYETGRAMGQIERDMNAKQLLQAKLDLAELHKLDIHPTQIVKKGALMKTPDAFYFMAIGLGTVKIHEQNIIVISPQSPLGIMLIGKSIGVEVLFNNRKILIEQIW